VGWLKRYERLLVVFEKLIDRVVELEKRVEKLERGI